MGARLGLLEGATFPAFSPESSVVSRRACLPVISFPRAARVGQNSASEPLYFDRLRRFLKAVKRAHNMFFCTGHVACIQQPAFSYGMPSLNKKRLELSFNKGSVLHSCQILCLQVRWTVSGTPLDVLRS